MEHRHYDCVAEEVYHLCIREEINSHIHIHDVEDIIPLATLVQDLDQAHSIFLPVLQLEFIRSFILLF